MKGIDAEKICYDPYMYQLARQNVRNARRNLENMNLSDDKRSFILGVSAEIATSALKFYKNKKTISIDPDMFNRELKHQAKMKLSGSLPEEYLEHVLNDVINLIINGVAESCKQIYDPITELCKARSPGLKRDYETDKAALDELPSFFSVDWDFYF